MNRDPRQVDFDALFQEEEWLRTLALRLAGDPETAEDLVQETWLASLRHPPVERGSNRAWLRRVMENASASRYRKEANRAKRETRVARPEAEAANQQMMERAELQQHLIAHIQNLDEQSHKVIVLRFLEGQTVRQVAKALELSEDATRKRIQRGLESLRATMEDRFGSDWRALCLALFPLATPGAIESSTVPTARVWLFPRYAAVLVIPLTVAIPIFFIPGDGFPASRPADAAMTTPSGNDAQVHEFVESDQAAVRRRALEVEGPAPRLARAFREDGSLVVRGRTFTPDGLPLAKAQVRTRFTSGSVLSDEQGNFEMVLPASSLERVPPSRGGAADAIWATHASFGPSEIQRLAFEASEEAVEIALQSGQLYRVSAVDESTGLPLAGVKLNTHRKGQRAFQTVLTNDQGVAEFCSDSSGEYLFSPSFDSLVRPERAQSHFIDTDPNSDVKVLLRPIPERQSWVARDARSKQVLEHARYYAVSPSTKPSNMSRIYPEAQWLPRETSDATLRWNPRLEALMGCLLVTCEGYFPVRVAAFGDLAGAHEVELVPMRKTSVRIQGSEAAKAERAELAWAYEVPMTEYPARNQPGRITHALYPGRTIKGTAVADRFGYVELPLPTGRDTIVRMKVTSPGGVETRLRPIPVDALNAGLSVLDLEEKRLASESSKLTLAFQAGNGEPISAPIVLLSCYEQGLHGRFEDQSLRTIVASSDENGICEFGLPKGVGFRWVAQTRLGQFRSCNTRSISGSELRLDLRLGDCEREIRGWIQVEQDSSQIGNPFPIELEISSLTDDDAPVAIVTAKDDGSFRGVCAGRAPYRITIPEYPSMSPVRVQSLARDVQLTLPRLQSIQVELFDELTRRPCTPREILLFAESSELIDRRSDGGDSRALCHLDPSVTAIAWLHDEFAPAVIDLDQQPASEILDLDVFFRPCRVLKLRVATENASSSAASSDALYWRRAGTTLWLKMAPFAPLSSGDETKGSQASCIWTTAPCEALEFALGEPDGTYRVAEQPVPAGSKDVTHALHF